MMDATPQFWSQMGEAFQQNLGKSFAQAMQHFQTIDLGGLGKDAPAGMPSLKFHADRLQALQMQSKPAQQPAGQGPSLLGRSLAEQPCGSLQCRHLPSECAHPHGSGRCR